MHFKRHTVERAAHSFVHEHRAHRTLRCHVATSIRREFLSPRSSSALLCFIVASDPRTFEAARLLPAYTPRLG